MTTFTPESQARAALVRVITAGDEPNGILPADCGPWETAIQQVYDAHAQGGSAQARVVFGALSMAHPDLGKLLAEDPKPAPPEDDADRQARLAALAVNESSFPDLPDAAQLDPALAVGASPWLDQYVAFSRRWSPRSYDGFHTACGLWLLSTIAARRVSIDLGKQRYTNLYFALCAHTSMHAKSTATEISQDVLAHAGLGHLLAPDDSSPQAFVRGMSNRLTADYADLPSNLQTDEKTRLAFAANRGWFHEEFGTKLNAMMRESGPMADYRGHLRRFDDCPPEYRYETISRGTDRIERPYVALLANLTPDDIAPHARKGAALWGDGFFARFAFVVPPADLKPSLARFPEGERVIPGALVQTLHTWHERLGIPTVTVTERTADAKGKPAFDAGITPAPGQRCTLGPGVYDSFYAYGDAMIITVYESGQRDLAGNYARLAEKALRVAMLLASLENQGRIEIRHWAKAQQIAEGWRSDLHSLVDALSASAEPSREHDTEGKVIRLLERGTPMTAREVGQFAHVSSAEAQQVLEHLTRLGEVTAEKIGRATRYGSVATVAVASVAKSQKAATLPDPAPATPDLAPLSARDYGFSVEAQAAQSEPVDPVEAEFDRLLAEEESGGAI